MVFLYDTIKLTSSAGLGDGRLKETKECRKQEVFMQASEQGQKAASVTATEFVAAPAEHGLCMHSWRDL